MTECKQSSITQRLALKLKSVQHAAVQETAFVHTQSARAILGQTLTCQHDSPDSSMESATELLHLLVSRQDSANSSLPVCDCDSVRCCVCQRSVAGDVICSVTYALKAFVRHICHPSLRPTIISDDVVRVGRQTNILAA